MRPLSDLVPAYVREFEAYTPSRPDAELMRQYGVTRLHRLNNNENALGPPPLAQAVIAGFAPIRTALYPSGDCYALRQTLAAKFGKTPENFLVGNGSCEVIASVIKAFCQQGDSIITADKTFAVYEWVSRFSGIDVRLVPLREYALDAEAMLAAMNKRTKILFVCNPNNPTGSWWNATQMERFLQAVGGRCIVVVDEAYCEYLDDPAYPDGLELYERHPNVLVFRTFSKMYGLAGLRVGYLSGRQELVDIIRRTHIVYSVGGLGQSAAQAALEDDTQHILDTRRMVEQAKTLVTGLFDDLGLEHVCGAGNFAMVHVPLSDTLLYRLLMRRGVMIRTMTGFRFPNWVRVSLAQPEAMADFAQAFRDVLKGR